MMLGIVLAASTSYFSGSSASAAEVTFSAEFMNDPKNIATGKGLFQKQCARCHGQRAYPGKAPKLKPEKYKADFVYRRITKGFRGMPGWKRRYNKLQRKSLTAYIMSKGFTN
ncbi:MAG: cytochrome c [Alphaproteobacteria bacterium]|nr:cytochrome c [Alphaproteobacteria bacterium]